ncbi:MAG: hypothetical protein JWR00_4396, partial [Rubritepida sp.]|nr:hypothetical protein [Rubritepida sp.]
SVTLGLTLHHQTGEARLWFDIGHGRPTGPQQQVVEMESTPCRFGGRRWWWVCPATGRRCATLYLPNGGKQFLSRGRGAYRLAYSSQRETEMTRTHRRLARLVGKLGGEYGRPDDPPPDRPKWMRMRTYDRLLAEWEDQVELLDEIFVADMERLTTRMQRWR